MRSFQSCGQIKSYYHILITTYIDGLEAAQTVAVDAALVGLDENVGADLGPLRRDAVGDEHLVHEFLHVVKVEDGVGLLFRSAGTAIGRLDLLGGRGDADAINRRADGKQYVGGVGIVRGSVGLEPVGKGGAEGGIEMASRVLADEVEEFGSEFSCGRHFYRKGMRNWEQKCNWDKGTDEEEGGVARLEWDSGRASSSGG